MKRPPTPDATRLLTMTEALAREFKAYGQELNEATLGRIRNKAYAVSNLQYARGLKAAPEAA